MGRIYTSAGWVNWNYIMDQPASIIMVVGARGVGKTYGVFDWLLSRGEKFLYLRRLKSQLDECRKPDGNPFKKIAADKGTPIVPIPAGGTVLFCRQDKTGPAVAVGVALSVVANLRGVDYSDINYIVFDEFISSYGERPIPHEFEAFLNFYETVNRNRELSGSAPVKCIMLGNANRLNNPYFAGWHLLKQSLNMVRGKQMVWRSADNTRMLFMLLESPISARKAETMLYKNATSDFITMALDNAFRTDATAIKPQPLNEYNHLVSVGEIGIYKHKSKRQYYYVSSTTSKDTYYQGYGMELKMFQTDYYLLRTQYMIYKSMLFESYEVELIFREYLNLD